MTFSVDSPENYHESVKRHVGLDTEVSLSKHKDIGDILSAHGVVWTRILAAGVFICHVHCIKDNMIVQLLLCMVYERIIRSMMMK